MNIFKKSNELYNEYTDKASGIYNSIPAAFQEVRDVYIDQEKTLEELEEEYRTKLRPIFEKEYNQLIDNYDFFWGCSFDVYLRDYEKRIMEFNNVYKDALEIDFINEEAGKLLEYPVKFYWMIYNANNHTCKNLDYSKNRKRKHLQEEALKLGYDLVFDFDYEFQNEGFTLDKFNKKTSTISNSNLYWNGSQTDFMELVKALIESEAIKAAKEKGKQKELTVELSKLFNIKINNPDKLITDFNKRNNGKETKFIDSLKKHLMRFIQD